VNPIQSVQNSFEFAPPKQQAKHAFAFDLMAPRDNSFFNISETHNLKSEDHKLKHEHQKLREAKLLKSKLAQKQHRHFSQSAAFRKK